MECSTYGSYLHNTSSCLETASEEPSTAFAGYDIKGESMNYKELESENSRYREALERIEKGNYLDSMEARSICRKALNPTPEMETVEVVKWWNVETGSFSDSEYLVGIIDGSKWVKLTGTMKVPKPQKVKRRVEVKAYIRDGIIVSIECGIKMPSGTRFFAEWEE